MSYVAVPDRIDAGSVDNCQRQFFGAERTHAAEAAVGAVKSIRHLVTYTSVGRCTDADGATHDLAHLLSHLGSLALNLPPLLTNLVTLAERLATNPTLIDDRATRDAADTSDTLLACLDDARAAAETLTHRLITGSSCAVHLHTSG